MSTATGVPVWSVSAPGDADPRLSLLRHQVPTFRHKAELSVTRALTGPASPFQNGNGPLPRRGSGPRVPTRKRAYFCWTNVTGMFRVEPLPPGASKAARFT